ncbi:MAG: hypothetical protein VB858_20940 [Planctomycetaceae bacterium]
MTVAVRSVTDRKSNGRSSRGDRPFSFAERGIAAGSNCIQVVFRDIHTIAQANLNSQWRPGPEKSATGLATGGP